MDTLDACQRLTRLGWHLCLNHWPLDNGHCSCGKPECAKPGKHPIGAVFPHGRDDATADLAVLAAALRRFPRANLAAATGAESGLFVLDVDGPAGLTSLRTILTEYGRFRATPRAVSGSGGVHVYLRWPTERSVRTGPIKGYPGLETRARGASITLPPSLHRSGQRYRWVAGRAPWDIDVADAPEWLLTLVDPPRPVQPMPVVDFTAEADRLRRYGKAALVRTCDELARTTSHRNCALNVAAFSLGRLIGAGCLDRAEVEPVLEGIAYQIGLEPGEIGATIESGITAGQRQPRYPLAG